MDKIRLENLKKLVLEVGNQSELARRAGISSSQVWQYINDRRKLGERTARKIEFKTGKPTGWLDKDASIKEPSSPFENTGELCLSQFYNLCEKIKMLPETEKKIVVIAVKNHLKTNPF